jgi:mRNA interferase MazF
MSLNQFDVWLADLSPRMGTEPGKTRPVVIIQTNLLNNINHPSTIICPITTNVTNNTAILRVHLQMGVAGVNENSDIMVDQMRSIDNRRLIKKIGALHEPKISKLKECIKVVIDLE